MVGPKTVKTVNLPFGGPTTRRKGRWDSRMSCTDAGQAAACLRDQTELRESGLSTKTDRQAPITVMLTKDYWRLRLVKYVLPRYGCGSTNTERALIRAADRSPGRGRHKPRNRVGGELRQGAGRRSDESVSGGGTSCLTQGAPSLSNPGRWTSRRLIRSPARPTPTTIFPPIPWLAAARA